MIQDVLKNSLGSNVNGDCPLCGKGCKTGFYGEDA